MIREERPVFYSYEHGDKSLPHLKDMVSGTLDPEKNKILDYLKTHCIVACAGVVRDEISPDSVIGCGDVYSDGTYVWDDVFFNYVDRYNIPVPVGFREHILKNYDERTERHRLLSKVDKVEIYNNPYLGYQYYVKICKNGHIFYRNNTDCVDDAFMLINPEDAAYIIEPMMTELFCYDSDEHGKHCIDGHYWKLIFYKGDTIVKTIEGITNEDPWRFNQMKNIIEFAERYIPKDLGYKHMEPVSEDIMRREQ